MDTIACGATIAFAMELYENEVINRDDTGGVESKYGNADAMLTILNQIVREVVQTVEGRPQRRLVYSAG